MHIRKNAFYKSLSFDEIILKDERDTEWKFSRTELWMTFIEPGCPVAPPFNIIPSIKNICEVWENICCICRRKQSKKRIKVGSFLSHSITIIQQKFHSFYNDFFFLN